MAKGKSSATSATRKKHARKAAGDDDTAPASINPSTKKGKLKKGETPPPQIKQYIPQSKPAPAQPDPLESLGLVHMLDKHLVVLLRKLGKKDSVTRAKAIEEIRVWCDKDESSGSMDMIPIWLHHLPSLYLHPARRIRLLAASLHDHLLDRADIRASIVSYIRDRASSSQSEAILGSWCLSSWDIDRTVARESNRSWAKTIRWKQNGTSPDPSMLALEDDELAEGLANFTCESLLAPDSLYLAIFPPAVQSLPLNPHSTRRLPGRQAPTSRESVGAELPRKSELDEESEDDRRARLRAGSLGSLKWLLDTSRTINTRPKFVLNLLQRLLSDMATFSTLHHSARPRFGDSGIESVAYGYNQPLVRRSAWALVQSLVNPCSGEPALKQYLPNISAYVLGSAWVEPDPTVRANMWVPLLTFLRDIPEAWTLAAKWKPDANDQVHGESAIDDDDGEASASSSDEEADESFGNRHLISPDESTHSNQPLASIDSWPYREFLQFLQLGCRGSPVQGYPTVVVILSTIPTEILPHSSSALSNLFASFWVAFDRRALSTSLEKERRDSVMAFLSALLECLVFYARRLWRGPGFPVDPPNREHSTSVDDQGTPTSDSHDMSLFLVREQWSRIWDVWTKAQLMLPGELFGVTLGKSLLRLYSVDEELFTRAWETISSIVLLSPRLTKDIDAVAVFSSIDEEFSRSSTDGRRLGVMTDPVIYNWMQIHIAQLSNQSEYGSTDMMDHADVLVSLLEKFGHRMTHNAGITSVLDRLIDDRISILLENLPPPSFISFFLAYARLQQGRAQSIWLSILSEIGSGAVSTFETRVQRLSALLEDSRVPETLKANDELSELVSLALDRCLLEDNTSDMYLGVLSGLFRKADIYLNTEVLLAVRSRLRRMFKTETDQLLRSREMSLVPIRVYLTLMEQFPTRFKDEAFLSDVMPHMFLLAHLLIDGNLYPKDLARATASWNEWRANASTTISVVDASIRQTLKSCLIDTEMAASPVVILDLASHIGGSEELSVSLGAGVLPDQASFDVSLSSIASSQPHASLAVMDPLVPMGSRSGKPRQVYSYDRHGLSPYARATLALHHAISRNRHASLQNLWTLRHLSALALFARDFAAIPSLSNPLFAPQDLPEAQLRAEEIVEKTHQSILYMLTAVSGEISFSWHQDMIASLREVGSRVPINGGQVAELIGILYSKSVLEEGPLFPRILHIVLRGILREASSEEANLWLGLAQTIQDRAGHSAMAIVLCLTNLNLEFPRLDRYRNEIASRLSGVSPQKAKTEGLKLLRLLDAAAPNAESGVIFLPTQRTVFMVQAFQKWVNGGDDLDEEIESQLVSVFIHIAPLLQSIPGSHWDFIADLVELNLESASFEDESLATLHRTLRLVLEVDQLASSNRALREVWSERQPGIYRLIKKLLVVPIDNLARSLPREICRALVVSIAASASTALVDDDSFISLPHLLSDTSVDVRLIAFQLMHDAAKKYTEKVILETEVDGTGDFTPSLPNKLMSMLETSVGTLETPPGDVLSPDSMTLLLAWMLVFDLFVDATPRVKAGYIEQLRSTNIVEVELLPFLFTCLEVGSSRKPFPLDVWSVDEYHVSLYDDSLPSSLRILAAHVYYRSLMMVPSLVRTWWLECKDRQLSAAVASYTSQQFSIKIIDQQLALVKLPHILGELQSESVSIKTVAALHEIIITYLIDDQQMEIGLRFPPDYPLHGLEIKDMKRVGVQENKWRGWLFNVQQIAQNGLVVDALFWFKKNVSSYFEGKVECAICYSIISVTDRTLPTKPCKTCKNRFHAGCLYKWFHTSHSSSCPLCRSDMF